MGLFEMLMIIRQTMNSDRLQMKGDLNVQERTVHAVGWIFEF